MDLSKIKAKLDSDPATYGPMSNQEAADALNTKNIPIYQRVASSELLAWSGANARVVKIQNAANGVAPFNSLPDEARAVAIVADLMVRRDGTGFDPNRADHLAMVDTLVAVSVLTQSDKDALLSLATKLVSWAEQEGLEPIEEKHVRDARTL